MRSIARKSIAFVVCCHAIYFKPR